MKSRLYAGIFILLISMAFVDRPQKEFKKLLSQQNAEPGFVVVELFTSEGCSSCPPADNLAAKLPNEYKTNVYVLGFHVDYWDRLGWKDAFSDHAYTERQNHYSKIFHLSSVYTPQVVINGQTEFVGSNRDKLYKTISEQLQRPGTKKTELTASVSGNHILTIIYHTQASENEELQIALVQLQVQTRVRAGENSGKTLTHARVVRHFSTISRPLKEGRISFILPPDLRVNDIRVIGFLQDRNNLKITSANEAAIQ